MKRCLIIFAREPKKGQVKSRLAKSVSQEKALDLYKAFLEDTLNLAQKVRCDQKILAYASKNSCPYLKKVGTGFYFHGQKGENLGDRMIEAINFCKKNFLSSQVVIIGTDSPHLPVRFIKGSFEALKRADIVLGPSEDGGFYLIGMRKTEPAIFKGVVWSSSSVLKKTLLNAKKLGLTTKLLESFFDIDTQKDLTKLRGFLKNKKRIALETQRVLKKME
jgi:hypothetical protein